LIGRAGYFIVVAFVVAWAAALLIYKARRIDERWSQKVRRVA
jgi:high-affinity nickel permease